MDDLMEPSSPADRSRLSDDRLAWLAVRDYVRSRCRPSGFLRIVGALTRGPAGDEARDFASDKAHSYAFAVGDAVQDLTPDDRMMLRRTGQVPDWFIARVEELRGAR
jgi:hypothetical protein